ncbi:unnamed protein product [Cercospora beticola]|nr:unnamed protein product [Cercospora beticola]
MTRTSKSLLERMGTKAILAILATSHMAKFELYHVPSATCTMTSNAPESLAYKELVFCLQLEPFLDEEDIEVWNARSPAASRVIIRFIGLPLVPRGFVVTRTNDWA